MTAWYRQHRKLVVALIGAAVTIATYELGADNVILVAVLPVLTALGVYVAPNES